MSEKNDEYRYVLWIRHCKACHNENAFFSEQPLCNENGINQAYEFGKQFSKINEMIQSLEEIKEKNLDKYRIYSSPLARAMETAKLISAGIKNGLSVADINTGIRKNITTVPEFLEDNDNKLFTSFDNQNIIRIGGIQEETNIGLMNNISKKQNSITQQLSDKYATLLNDNIQDGLQISLDKPINPSDEYISKSKEELESNYTNFIDNFLFTENIFENKINLIVSHSAFIKANLKLNCSLNNLDSIFCIYEKENPIPIKKYLILFQDLVLNPSISLQLVDDIRQDQCIEEGGIISKKKYRYGNVEQLKKEKQKISNNTENTENINKMFKNCDKFKKCNYNLDKDQHKCVIVSHNSDNIPKQEIQTNISLDKDYFVNKELSAGKKNKKSKKHRKSKKHKKSKKHRESIKRRKSKKHRKSIKHRK